MTELYHYGTPRHSGRYPWGSGENPYQRNKSFIAYDDQLRKEGLTEKERAENMGITINQLRARRSIAVNENKAEDRIKAKKYREKGYSYAAIAKEIDSTPGKVRALLDDDRKQNQNTVLSTADMLQSRVDDVGYIDIGEGAERYLGISKTALATAAAALEEKGYVLKKIKVKQLGTDHMLTVKVLAKPETTTGDIQKNLESIKMITDLHSEDRGATWDPIEEPISIDSSRVCIRYGEEGGADRDGVIELRRGVDDISLGQASYAQVRIGVDGTHYLKGMAVYADDIPDGYDIRFNTHKTSELSKMDVMKPMEVDKATGQVDRANPFATDIKESDELRLVQRHYIDKNGERKLSAINVVNEEGDWGRWSKTLSSQFLSKQSPTLAKQQLDIAYARRKNEFDEIMSLTNPVLKAKLLDDFSDACDSASVHLKAAALPRQTVSVILPDPNLKENEVYARNYRNGETVVLIRHPHGGIFEIPTLRVNNRQESSAKLVGNTTDAICINPKVAARLSGADFDGDTVTIIPNNNKSIATAPALAGLKDFDPHATYPYYEGMKIMTKREVGLEMGRISNLITDMTLHKASDDELARAVRHSMVVIDAKKHKLDYKRSEVENGIDALRKKYQMNPETGKYGGASTLISRAKSEMRVTHRSDYFKIDPDTGEKVYNEKPEFYTNKNGKLVERHTISTKMAETKDAFDLSSGTEMEAVYATYANSMKAMANEARKARLATPKLKMDPKAKQIYAAEVADLKAQLNEALKNAPLERQAQLVANAKVRMKVSEDPSIKEDRDTYKKVQAQSLKRARREVGANKKAVLVEITPRQWEAIQAGALSQTTVEQIFRNTDIDKVREYATPKNRPTLSAAQKSRARSMLNRGMTQAEVADALGISVTTVNELV